MSHKDLIASKVCPFDSPNFMLLRTKATKIWKCLIAVKSTPRARVAIAELLQMLRYRYKMIRQFSQIEKSFQKYSLVEERIIPGQPHIGWQTPAKFLVFFSLATLSAVGRHFFHDSLNATTVTTSDDAVSSWKTQEWVIRYGLGLAFITKTLLACTAAAAYKQRIWRDFRQTQYTVAGINAISDATTEILSFADWEFLRRAKIAVLLAALTW
jgi:hypothetical protein